jgi:cytochrome c biogenesis protein CcdA
MYKKLNNLGFVIGIFFIIISLILLIGGLLSDALDNTLDYYTGFTFIIFGALMVFFNRKNDVPIQD